MAFCRLDFFGPSIQRQQGANVIIPDGDGPFPVLYLLHGLSDDYTIWARRTSIERYVAELPLIVVMADGHRSWYANAPGGEAYEDYIAKDIVGMIDRTFRTIAAPAGRAIAGLSMGGYGATMLAMKHPDVFSVAVSHSGAMDIRFVAPHLPTSQYDTFHLARKLAKSGKKIAFRMDCGTDDRLIEHSRQFHAHLEKLGIAHEYAEHPGEHNWEYWDTHIQDTLAFVMKHVKKPKKKKLIS